MRQAPKRRWLQFGFATVLIGVAVAACWIEWNIRTVQPRRASMASIESRDRVVHP